MEYGVYIGIFVLLLGAVGVVVWGTRPSARDEKVRTSLQQLDTLDARAYSRAELALPASQRLVKPAVGRLAAAARRITPTGRIRRLEAKIERAGRPWNLDVNGLLILKLVSLAVGLAVLVLLAVFDLLPLGWFVLLAVVVVVLTYYLPDIVLHLSTNTRKKEISRSLPDFLDLLTVTVEAGLGLDSALAKVAERLKDPLREEILLTLHHIRMGESRDAALRAFADRCGVEDLTNFVSALNQSQKLGISLGQVLRIQSETIRTVQRQRIEERAQKAPVKMLIPLIFCIFPVMFVVILGPTLIKLYHVLFG